LAAARVWLAVRPFGLDVDQDHLHPAERLRELAFAAIALVAEPRALRTRVELFGIADVGTAATAKPNVLKPIDSSATLPARIILMES
jgi:hypothetical protein